MADSKNPILTQEQMTAVMDKCYHYAVDGLPKMKTTADLAEDYLVQYSSKEEAAKKMISAQIAKCSTSGFLSGLGGVITLPVTVPANIGSVLYVQLRMISALAYMGGYDVHSDQVQTLAYTCLVGTSVVDICKSAGVIVANKATTNLLKKLPGKILTKINQMVGFRLLTKFGTKGVINLVKLVPVAGGVVGAGVDFASTKAISKKAYDMFILGKID